MPLQGNLEAEIFDVRGLDFLGLFPSSNGYKYILVAVEFVSKYVEATALVTNDAKVVVNIVKKYIFIRFCTPRVMTLFHLKGCDRTSCLKLGKTIT